MMIFFHQLHLLRQKTALGSSDTMTELNTMLSLLTDPAKPNDAESKGWEDGMLFLKAFFVRWVLPTTTLGFSGNGISLWFLCSRMKRSKLTAYVLNLAIADVTSMPTLMTCSHPQSRELLSSLDLMLGIIFSAGYNAGPFLLTAASAARCPRVLSPTRHWRSQPEPLSPHACALLRSLRSPARSVAWGISPKEGLTSSARRGVWERQSSLCPSDSQALWNADFLHCCPSSSFTFLLHSTSPTAVQTPPVSFCVEGWRKMRLREAIQRALRKALKDSTGRARWEQKQSQDGLETQEFSHKILSKGCTWWTSFSDLWRL